MDDDDKLVEPGKVLVVTYPIGYGGQAWLFRQGGDTKPSIQNATSYVLEDGEKVRVEACGVNRPNGTLRSSEYTTIRNENGIAIITQDAEVGLPKFDPSPITMGDRSRIQALLRTRRGTAEDR